MGRLSGIVRLNVGLMVYGDLATLTGGYLYDRQMVNCLERFGHAVHLVSLPDRYKLVRFLDNGSRRVMDRVARGGLDILVQDELCFPSLLLFNRLLRGRSRVPVVAVVHHLASTEPRPPWQNRLLAGPERWYLDTVDGFVVNSRTTAGAVAALSPEPRPTLVAPPGGDRLETPVSAATIRERAAAPGPLRLLFLGMVTARKGLLPLLEALAAVPKDGWHLDVVGSLTLDPVHVRMAKRRIRKMGLGANIRFTGVLSDDALAGLLAGAHLMCMPYAYEGFGIATLEAMTAGLPVLGSTSGATGELVRHGVTGWLIRPGDIDAASAVVRRLAANRDRLAAAGVSAWRQARQHPTWDASMARIQVFLRDMASPVRRTADP